MLDSSAMDDEVKDKYPFRFIDGPLSLVTLASTELSLALWRRKISNCGETTPDKMLKRNFSCAEFFIVPRRLSDIIDDLIVSVGEDLQKWERFQLKLDEDLRFVFSSTWDNIVFEANGKISYSKTAAKAIKKDGINDEFKLKIACIFCLEDEIKRLWPTMSRNGGCDKFSLANKDYWHGLIMSSEDTSRTPIKNRIQGECNKNNRGSLRYFCDKLDGKEVPSTVSLVLKKNNLDALMFLLPKLKEHQAREIFKEKASAILSILLSNREYVECVLTFWTSMESVISKEAFLQVIHELCKLLWNVPQTNRTVRGKIDGILIEIWGRAQKHLRSHVVKHSAEVFNGLSSQSSGFAISYGHNMEFLLDLLRSSSAEFWKTEWFNEKWPAIVFRAKPLYLKQFVELCVYGDEAIRDCKSKLLNHKSIYIDFIRNGFYSDLADYLNFCSETSTLKRKLSQQIFGNHMGMVITSLLDGNNFENFNSFVDGLFSDAESASKFKQSLLWSPSSVNSLFCIFNKGRLKDCQEIITRFSTSEKNLEKMKSNFLDYSGPFLPSKLDDKWEELLKWCTKNEDKIAAFKRSLEVVGVTIHRNKIAKFQ